MACQKKSGEGEKKEGEKKKRQTKKEIRRWGDYMESRTCNAAGNDNWGIYAKFTNIFHKYHNIGQVLWVESDIRGETSRFRMLISLFLLLFFFFFVFQHNIKKQYIFYPLLSLDCMLCTIACLGSDDHLLIPRPSEEQRGGHRQIRMLQNNLSSPQGRRRNPKYIYKKGRRLDRGRHSCARWLHVTQWVMIKWSAKSFEYQA